MILYYSVLNNILLILCVSVSYDFITTVALEMKQRQVELTKVEEELKKKNQEILDLQLRLHEAEKTLVR